MEISNEDLNKFIEMLERMEKESMGFRAARGAAMTSALNGYLTQSKNAFSEAEYIYVMTIVNTLSALYVERARRDRTSSKESE